MKKVFFNLRNSSRERMWDTAREAHRVCEPLTPQLTQRTSIERRIGGNRGPGRINYLKQVIFRWLPLINRQHTPGSDDADMLYLWGAFPKVVLKPFILEMDNPFVLTYYKKWVFRLRLSTLKRKLRTAKRLTFLSETARAHALQIFGTEFATKSCVLPPFMARGYTKKISNDDNIVRFLFVGLGFRRKGGPELLHAFSQLPHENARLTIVAPVEEEVRKRYCNDRRITFLPPQPREKLLTELYPAHDIFVFPSLLETLGVVILEALSYGMGIITTDLYATPEMVKDTVNGRLLPHPFLSHTKLYDRSVIDCVSPDRSVLEATYANIELFSEHAENVRSAMETGITQVKQWRAGSIQLFEKEFAPEKWESRLAQIIAK